MTPCRRPRNPDQFRGFARDTLSWPLSGPLRPMAADVHSLESPNREGPRA
jgi:hypothetical protein